MNPAVVFLRLGPLAFAAVGEVGLEQREIDAHKGGMRKTLMLETFLAGDLRLAVIAGQDEPARLQQRQQPFQRADGSVVVQQMPGAILGKLHREVQVRNRFGLDALRYIGQHGQPIAHPPPRLARLSPQSDSSRAGGAIQRGRVAVRCPGPVGHGHAPGTGR